MVNIYLTKPRGFCAGVERAIGTVELVLQKYSKPVYVRHQIVHNQHVVNELEKKGAIFVENLNEIPKDSNVIFSAHGIPPEVMEESKRLNLNFIDATCPLVTKVHIEAKLYYQRGYDIILIGHKGHQEVIGTMGYAPMMLVENVKDVGKLDIKNDKIICLTQTTLSLDDTKEITKALKEKYPNIKFPPKEDICYATQNRQNAVKVLSDRCDLILVIGSKNSSNSNRLVETAKFKGVESYLIQDFKDVKEDIIKYKNIGITSGASTPEILVKKVLEHLKNLFKEVNISEIVDKEENVKFVLPIELR